jgi:hypothetical protein
MGGFHRLRSTTTSGRPAGHGQRSTADSRFSGSIRLISSRLHRRSQHMARYQRGCTGTRPHHRWRWAGAANAERRPRPVSRPWTPARPWLRRGRRRRPTRPPPPRLASPLPEQAARETEIGGSCALGAGGSRLSPQVGLSSFSAPPPRPCVIRSIARHEPPHLRHMHWLGVGLIIGVSRMVRGVGGWAVFRRCWLCAGGCFGLRREGADRESRGVAPMPGRPPRATICW